MRNISELISFINSTMSMTDVYQPAVILHLLERGGTSTRAELAKTLSGYDEGVQEYYDKILMRWPKITLTKHKIIKYERKNLSFALNFNLSDPQIVEEAKELCDQKIREWIEKKRQRRTLPRIEASVRYRILKAARGKCELCGISSKLAPIDIDHIVPKSRADKHGYVTKDNITMHVDDERNLQSLCYRCNRAKRDQDATDFRQPRSGIIRDQRVVYVAGTTNATRKLEGVELRDKLFEKLIDDHARLIDQDSEEEFDTRVTDMIETLLAIAKVDGNTEDELFELIKQRREELGRLDTGLYIDENVA
jgi:5-methylcytosine-specific restriction endonuclease McrA/predicted house-cleaning noncanonical NTP pyrophosphatase (MazG superfamily)